MKPTKHTPSCKPASVQRFLRSTLWRVAPLPALILLMSIAAAMAEETNATEAVALSKAPTPIKADPLHLAPSYPRLVWDDTRLVLSAPARWDKHDWLKFSAASLAVVGSGFLLDRRVAEHVKNNNNDSLSSALKKIEPFGAEYSFGVLGAFYVAGAVTDDSNAKQVTGDGLAASLIASGIITPTLKFAAGRSRPVDDKGPHDFNPFSNNNSFPSGHTTQAFAVGSVIAEHYDAPWIKFLSYGMASLVGLARIDHGAHYTSDVVAGALIGTSVGRSVVHINNRERAGNMTLSPVIGDDLYGAAVCCSF